MTSHSSGYRETKPRMREWATAVGLAGLIGSLVDWVIVLSQFAQRGDVSPILPPLSLVTLILGIIVSIPAIALTSRTRARPAAAAGVAIAGSSSSRSLPPRGLLLVQGMPGASLAILALVTVAAILMMWFGLPRV